MIVTADLCDQHPDETQALDPHLRHFGGDRTFAGPAVTLKVFEDNALVRAALEQPGEGRVLVVDGGGSLRTALVGGNLGKLAETHGWAGVVVHGAVRDVRELGGCRVGVMALASTPKKSAKAGKGEREVPVTISGVTVAPGNWVYADEDGVIVAPRAVHGGR